jgi:hypothetical protein
MHDLTEAAIIAEVEADIDRHQARRRARRVIDAARLQLMKQKCRRQGIPTSSAQCAAVMTRANEALMRQPESTPKLMGALLGWSDSSGQMLLAENMEERKLYPWSLPPLGGGRMTTEQVPPPSQPFQRSNRESS